jgi:hypothetical protein
MLAPRGRDMTMPSIADLEERWEALCKELDEADRDRMTAMRGIIPRLVAVAAGGRQPPAESPMLPWDEAERRYAAIRTEMDNTIAELRRRLWFA